MTGAKRGVRGRGAPGRLWGFRPGAGTIVALAGVLLCVGVAIPALRHGSHGGAADRSSAAASAAPIAAPASSAAAFDEAAPASTAAAAVTSAGADAAAAGAVGSSAASAAPGTVGTEPAVDGALADPSRRIARTASLTIRVPTGGLDARVAAVSALATGAGGYVQASRAHGVAGRVPDSAVITVRVPSERFDGVLARLASLGTVLDRQVDAQDLTSDYVDAQSRLRHLRDVESRLVLLLDRANRVGDVLAIQNRLDGVQERLEVDEGRLKEIGQVTSYSTATVTLRERLAPAPRVLHGGVLALPRSRGWGLRTAAGDGAHNFVDSVNGAIRVLGAVAPLALSALLVLVGLALGRRRRRRRDGSAPVPGAATTTGAGPAG